MWLMDHQARSVAVICLTFAWSAPDPWRTGVISREVMFIWKYQITALIDVPDLKRNLVSVVSLTYLLTPWSRVLEKLTGSQVVKKLFALHGTRRFITAFTSFFKDSVSWSEWKKGQFNLKLRNSTSYTRDPAPRCAVTNNRILLVVRCVNEIIVTEQIGRLGRSFVANSYRCRKLTSGPRSWVVLLTGSVGVLPSYGITPSPSWWLVRTTSTSREVERRSRCKGVTCSGLNELNVRHACEIFGQLDETRGPTKDNKTWRIKTNEELDKLIKH